MTHFRSLPKCWVILANQIALVIDIDHPAVKAMLVHANEDVFAGCLLTSKALQQYGIYHGKCTYLYKISIHSKVI